MVYVLEQRYEPRAARCPTPAFIAEVGLEPFEAGVVLPHERTLPKALGDRFNLTRACAANFSQVLRVSIRTSDGDTDALFAEAMAGEPALIATDDDGVTSTVWAVTDPGVPRAPQRQRSPRAPIFIADGHHRYTTALAYRDERRRGERRGCRRCRVRDDGAREHGRSRSRGTPTHRVACAPGEFDRDAFYAALSEYFEIEDLLERAPGWSARWLRHARFLVKTPGDAAPRRIVAAGRRRPRRCDPARPLLGVEGPRCRGATGAHPRSAARHPPRSPRDARAALLREGRARRAQARRDARCVVVHHEADAAWSRCGPSHSRARSCRRSRRTSTPNCSPASSREGWTRPGLRRPPTPTILYAREPRTHVAEPHSGHFGRPWPARLSPDEPCGKVERPGRLGAREQGRSLDRLASVLMRQGRFAGRRVAPERRRRPGRTPRPARSTPKCSAGSLRPSPTSCPDPRKAREALGHVQRVGAPGQILSALPPYSVSTMQPADTTHPGRVFLKRCSIGAACTARRTPSGSEHMRPGSRCPRRRRSSHGADQARSAGIPCVKSTPRRNAKGSSRSKLVGRGVLGEGAAYLSGPCSRQARARTRQSPCDRRA